ncbi:MAG: radical SAM family heme chaperone HemW [Ferruginibacter sp.]
MAGIYIHIPFCKQACTYCNFHFSTNLKQREAVIAAIIKEITDCNFFSDEEKIATVYFGGGTPSLLSEDEIVSLFAALHKEFNISVDAEITLEANPDNISKEALALWQKAGINRLSIGIQSFDEAELRWMNRAHTANESLACLAQIKASGFTNYSVDLIYGSPLLTDENFKRNVDIIFAHQVPHISGYALTVEPKTALDKMIRQKKSLPVDADKQANHFILLTQWMKEKGYEHYEISNFALPGMRSQHNSSYWKGIPYYGFGPSAHSFDGKKVRRWNVSNNAVYTKALLNNLVFYTEEVLTPTQQINEAIMIGLRTMEGIELDKIKLRFGDTVSEQLLKNSTKYINNNLMVLRNNLLILTQEGKLLADGIAGDLFM